MSDPWICYGAGSIIASTLGFVLFAVVLEFIGSYEISPIEYGKNLKDGAPKRSNLNRKTNEKVPKWDQLMGTLSSVCGPHAWVNGAVAALAMPYFMPALETLPLLPTLQEFLIQFVLMELIGDFGLYWGHRIQHENEYLWKNCHSVHHSIDTPSAVSVAYIHPVDATLQGSLPMLLAVLAVQAHPVSMAVYFFFRIGENTLNHCGCDHWLLNLVTLKSLPLRASIQHHDEHHKYSGYSGKAKNFAENFIIWDWMFGTLRKKSD